MTCTLDDLAEWDTTRGVNEGLEQITLKTTYPIHWKHIRRLFKSPHISYGDLADYVAKRRKEGVTGQTIRKELQTLRRGLKEARRRGHNIPIPEDWPRLKNDAQSKQKAGKRWPLGTFRQWLELLPEHVRDELYFDFLTGLRYTELKNARHSWVRAAPSGSEVPAVLQVPPRAGKDKERGREIGLSHEALFIIVRAAERTGGVGPIFEPGDHKRYYAQARKVLGLECNVTRRDARHMFASVAIEGSQDATAVMRLMGHKDLKTTARYLHTETNRVLAASATVTAAFLLDGPPALPVQASPISARLAQLDRALASGAKGQRFDEPPWADSEDIIPLD